MKNGFFDPLGTIPINTVSHYTPPPSVTSNIDSFLLEKHLDLNSLPKFDFKNIEILESLGHGGCGCVYKALDHHNKKAKKFLALKSPLIPLSKMGPNLAILVNEKQMLEELTSLNDSSFTKLEGLYRGILQPSSFPSDSLIIAIEYGFGNMDEILNMRKQEKTPNFYSEEEICYIISYLSAGLEKAQKNNLIHRDIKPQNLIICNFKAEEYRYKFIDFGLSSKVSEGKMVTATGFTVGYVAPEILAGRYDPRKADVFSFGIVILEMMGCEKKTIKMISKKGIQEARTSTKQNYAKILGIVQEMIRIDPETRCSISEVLQKVNSLKRTKPNEDKYIQNLKKKDIETIKNDKVNNHQSILKTIGILEFYDEYEEALKYIEQTLQNQKLDKPLKIMLKRERILCSKMKGIANSAFNDILEVAETILESCGENSFEYWEILIDFADAFGDGISLKKSKQCLFKCYNLILLNKNYNFLTIGLLHNLASNYHKLHNLKKALFLVERSILFYEKLLKINPEFAGLIRNYANEIDLYVRVLQDLGQFSKAIEVTGKALQIVLTFEGKNNVPYINLLVSLGCILGRIGDFSEAIKNHKEALELAFALFGENHVLTADCFYFIAKDYFGSADKKWTEILFYSEKSLRIYKMLFGENHPRVYQALNLIALSHKSLNECDTALREFEYLKEMVKNTQGENTQLYLNIVANIGEIFKQAYLFDLALQNLEKAYEISCRLFGEESYKTADVMFNLSTIYAVDGTKRNKAEQFLKSCLSIYQKCYGESNEKTINCKERLNNLSFVREALQTNGVLETAISNYNVYSCILNSEFHDDAIHILNSISLIYKNQGNFKKALYIVRKSFNLSLFPPFNKFSFTDITALILANLYEDLNLFKKAVKYYEIGLSEMLNACLAFNNVSNQSISSKPCTNCQGTLRSTKQMKQRLYICGNCNGLHIALAGGFYCKDCKDCDNIMCLECANRENVLCRNCRDPLFWTNEIKEERDIDLDKYEDYLNAKYCCGICRQERLRYSGCFACLNCQQYAVCFICKSYSLEHFDKRKINY